MFSLDRINEYVTTVCQQIRWKKAHTRVAEEMTNHILDGRDSYIARGIDEKTATEKAIAETGDATAIGSQLDRIHRPKPQWGMFAATAVLLLLGFLARLFIFNDEDRVGLIGGQFVWAGIGIAGMIIAYFTDFTIVGKYPKAVFGGIMSISAAMLFFSETVNGRLFGAQYAVLLFPLAFSAIIFATKSKGYWGIALCGLAFALPCLIVLYIPSFSGFLHLAVVGAVLLGIAIYKRWFGTKRTYGFLLMIVLIALLTIVFSISMPSYELDRLASAFSPSVAPHGAGYLNIMTRELLGGAKLLGLGDMPSEHYIWLTEPSNYFYTDLLLTALISLLGWIAFAVIVGALLFFIVKGFMLSFKQKSNLGLFVSVAIMLMFSMQVFSYIAFNFGFQFAGPISLPLISYGNTATVINLVLIGFMLSVFRTGDVVTDAAVSATIVHSRLISWTDGKLTIHIKTQGGLCQKGLQRKAHGSYCWRTLIRRKKESE